MITSPSQQGANRLVHVRYAVSPERHLGVCRHAVSRDITLECIHKLPPGHEFLPLSEAALRAVRFQAALDGVEEAESNAAVEDAVVEGDLQVHHAPDRDGFVYHYGAFDDGFGLEDGRLRVVDDRRGGDAPESARVVHCEGAPRYVLGAELFGTRALHDVVYPAGEADDVEFVGVPDDGDYEGSLLQVYRDPDADLPPQNDPVPVPHGVEDRLLLEVLHGGLDDERQVRELDALALGKGRLLPLAQRREARHVHLDQRPGVRY